MSHPFRRDVIARTAVTVGSLLPYAPLLSLNRIYITDDFFASDIFNGELPARVLVGQLAASGQLPAWSSSLCSGVPITGGFEPLSFGLFAALAPAPALCLLVIALVLVAAHGAYALARRFGANPSGAVLAGIAFAGSGYMVTQLKHLAIVSTVVWLPWGLLLLDRALAQAPPCANAEARLRAPFSPSLTHRLRDIGLFGLVFAEQVAAGFPQTAYISGLVYATWSILLLARVRGRVRRVPLGLLLGAAVMAATTLAFVAGAMSLLPLVDLSHTSDRRVELTWQFASMVPYSWRDAWNFIIPYFNGDISDNTYHQPGFFWENYGYVGIVTAGLALLAAIRGWRQPRVLPLVALAVGAFILVLGPNTPVYYLAWKYLPGMDHFRFPTRFLFVVDLCLAVLGGVGLRLLQNEIERWLARSAPLASRILPPAVAFGTALDLFAHQSRQNPFVPAAEWLATPNVIEVLGESASRARLYAPLHNFLHRLAFHTARGWSDLNPYRELRETVAPNTGVFWGVSTADCYAGIGPSWQVDVWGDHSRTGFVVPPTMRLAGEAIVTTPTFATILATYGVTHIVSPLPVLHPQLKELPTQGIVHLYEIPGKRLRVVPRARPVRSNREAAHLLSRSDFDPDREVLLQGALSSEPPIGDPTAAEFAAPVSAQIVSEDTRRLQISVTAPQGGYLLLADTYYPGWRASIEGKPTRIYRANISLRAVRLPPGARFVDFEYEALPLLRGLRISVAGVLALLLWSTIATYLLRRQTSPGDSAMSAAG